MNWHAYRLVSDIAVVTAGLGVIAYCWRTPRRRPYIVGFTLITAAAVGELLHATLSPKPGGIMSLAWTVVVLLLLGTGLFSVLKRWRGEQSV